MALVTVTAPVPALMLMPLPATMYVDYVRVYQWNGKGEVTLGPPTAATGRVGVYTDNTPVTSNSKLRGIMNPVAAFICAPTEVISTSFEPTVAFMRSGSRSRSPQPAFPVQQHRLWRRTIALRAVFELAAVDVA